MSLKAWLTGVSRRTLYAASMTSLGWVVSHALEHIPHPTHPKTLFSSPCMTAMGSQPPWP